MARSYSSNIIGAKRAEETPSAKLWESSERPLTELIDNFLQRKTPGNEQALINRLNQRRPEDDKAMDDYVQPRLMGKQDPRTTMLIAFYYKYTKQDLTQYDILATRALNDSADGRSDPLTLVEAAFSMLNDMSGQKQDAQFFKDLETVKQTFREAIAYGRKNPPPDPRAEFGLGKAYELSSIYCPHISKECEVKAKEHYESAIALGDMSAQVYFAARDVAAHPRDDLFQARVTLREADYMNHKAATDYTQKEKNDVVRATRKQGSTDNLFIDTSRYVQIYFSVTSSSPEDGLKIRAHLLSQLAKYGPDTCMKLFEEDPFVCKRIAPLLAKMDNKEADSVRQLLPPARQRELRKLEAQATVVSHASPHVISDHVKAPHTPTPLAALSTFHHDDKTKDASRPRGETTSFETAKGKTPDEERAQQRRGNPGAKGRRG